MKVYSYILKDSQTGAILATYPEAKRKSARAKAEKMNQSYGAVRYVVSLVTTDI